VHDHIARHLASIEGPFVVSEEAEKFVARMRETAPDELDAWLAERVVWLVAEEMRYQLRSNRARNRAHAGARRFAEHLDLDDTPTADDVDLYATAYRINDSNVWKTVGDMTGDDHRYVARKYEATGKRALALAAFHEIIAKRVGTKTTAQVMDVDEYRRLLREIEGS
jgi:hypothetical protein